LLFYIVASTAVGVCKISDLWQRGLTVSQNQKSFVPSVRLFIALANSSVLKYLLSSPRTTRDALLQNTF
jgi:hypothetical protein